MWGYGAPITRALAVAAGVCMLAVFSESILECGHPGGSRAGSGKVIAFDVNAARAQHADTFMVIPASGLKNPLYADSSRQLHPSIVVIPDGWPARDKTIPPWKQWLAVTPMATVDADENPHLFARNGDDERWTQFIGVDAADSIINPLFEKTRFVLDTAFWFSNSRDTVYYDTTNGRHDSITTGHRSHHLSDPDIFIGWDGNLWMVFRVSWSVSGIDMHAIYAASSTNGRDWSHMRRITRLGRFMSPAVICRGTDGYVMFCTSQSDGVSGVRGEGEICRFTAERPDTVWTYEGLSVYANDPKGFGMAWHLDVLARKPEELVAILHTVNRSALWFGYSRDAGINWTIADAPFLISSGDSTRWDAFLYRASGYWLDSSMTEMGLVYSGYCVWDTNGPTPGGQSTRWHTGLTKVIFTVAERPADD